MELNTSCSCAILSSGVFMKLYHDAILHSRLLCLFLPKFVFFLSSTLPILFLPTFIIVSVCTSHSNVFLTCFSFAFSQWFIYFSTFSTERCVFPAIFPLQPVKFYINSFIVFDVCLLFSFLSFHFLLLSSITCRRLARYLPSFLSFFFLFNPDTQFTYSISLVDGEPFVLHAS